MKELIYVINQNCALKMELQDTRRELSELLNQTCNTHGIESKTLDQIIDLEDKNEALKEEVEELCIIISAMQQELLQFKKKLND